MLNPHLRILIGVLLISFISSCDDDDVEIFQQNLDPSLELTADPVILLNPSGVAPLTATISFSTNISVIPKIRVIGKNGEASDVVKSFPSASNFEIPILGLYADYNNEIELSFSDAQSNNLGTINFSLQTAPLIADMPEIDINVVNPSMMKPGFNFVNYFGHNGTFRPQKPFMFDQFGDIRWYLDYTDHPILGNLFYDNGMARLRNGNLFFGDGIFQGVSGTNAIHEINMLGEIQNSWDLQGFEFHHHVIEKPNGNFVVTVNDNTLPTIEDIILEIDRNSGEIVNKWDLNISLDNKRQVWDTQFADINVDWFHANALVFSEEDNSIIVSGRTQGTIKLSENNEVIWMIAPHRGWNNAGNGTDLNQFLLQPLDAQGQAISDIQVLDGDINHPDFEWAWYQHSPELLANGELLIFDNGDNRNYQGLATYSRAVLFEIDEENMTIQQKWSYGKDRGLETYSQVVSRVHYHENEGNVLFVPGGIGAPGQGTGKIIEVNVNSNEVVFEATIKPPISLFNIALHSAERFSLYPED